MTTAPDRQLPKSIDVKGIPIDLALVQLANALEEIARGMFPVSDIEVSRNIDLPAGKAALHFRACR